MAEICWDREKWRKEGTVGLSFLDVSSFYPSNLSSNSYDLNCFCAEKFFIKTLLGWSFKQFAVFPHFPWVPNVPFVVLELALKFLLKTPAKPEKNTTAGKKSGSWKNVKSKLPMNMTSFTAERAHNPCWQHLGRGWRLRTPGWQIILSKLITRSRFCIMQDSCFKCCCVKLWWFCLDRGQRW